MKNIKKAIAFTAALVLTAGFTACGSVGENDKDAASETTTATMKSEFAEVVEQIDVNADKLENGTLKWLSFWDINPTEGKPVPVSLELFQTKYGGKIEWIPTTYETRYNTLATLVLAGNSPDMFPAADLDTFPRKVVSGMFDPMDDYIDYNSELWTEGAKQINELHSAGGNHYIACVSSEAGLVMIYNKKTIEANGLDDPAELAYNNEWTWAKFEAMCYEFSNRDKGKFAIDGWWYEPAMIVTTGVPIIGMENGKLKNNLMSPAIERVENLFLEMKKADVMFPHDEYDWQVFPEKIGEGKTLFYPIGRWALLEPDLSAYGEEGDIMFVPTPRDENADAWYLDANGGLDAYALCKGAPNPEAVAAYVECKLIEGTDQSVQAVNEQNLRENYHWTDEMIKMDNYIGELTNAHPVVDFYTSVNDDVTNLLADPIKAASYHGTDWYSQRDSLYEAVEVNIEDMNKILETLS